MNYWQTFENFVLAVRGDSLKGEGETAARTIEPPPELTETLPPKKKKRKRSPPLTQP